jgi:hypothetical protein
MLLKCLKIFRKSIDKKALRQGRHLMLLFPSPKIMPSKEETSRKIQILLKFCITFVLRYILVKFRYDKLIYVFSFLRSSQFYASLAKNLFPKHAS